MWRFVQRLPPCGQGVEGGCEVPATMIEALAETSRDKIAVNKVLTK
jgi:hypothetical protein